MRRVRVKGAMGAVLNFPDEMSDEDIQKELDRLVGATSGPTAQPSPTTVQSAPVTTEPFVGIDGMDIGTTPNVGRWNSAATGAKIGQAFSEGAAGLAQGAGESLDYLLRAPVKAGSAIQGAIYPEQQQPEPIPPGTFRPEAIDIAVKFWAENAKEMSDLAVKEGATVADEVVGKAVGGAIPGVAQFMLNVPYSVLTSMSEAEKKGENEVVAGIVGGLKRALLGQIFHASAVLNPALRAGTLGTVGAIEGYAATGDPMEAAKEAGTMTMMGVLPVPGGGRPGMGVRNVVRQAWESRIPRPAVDPAEIARQRIAEQSKQIADEPQVAAPPVQTPPPVTNAPVQAPDLSQVLFPQAPAPEAPQVGPGVPYTEVLATPPKGTRPPAPPPQAEAPPELTPSPPGFSQFQEVGAAAEGFRKARSEAQSTGKIEDWEKANKINNDLLDQIKEGKLVPVIPDERFAPVDYVPADQKTEGPATPPVAAATPVVAETPPTTPPTLGEIYAPESNAAQFLTETAPKKGKTPKKAPAPAYDQAHNDQVASLGTYISGLQEGKKITVNVDGEIGPGYASTYPPWFKSIFPSDSAQAVAAAVRKYTEGGKLTRKEARIVNEIHKLVDESTARGVDAVTERPLNEQYIPQEEPPPEPPRMEIRPQAKPTPQAPQAPIPEAPTGKDIIPESAIKPGDQFTVKGEKYRALEYDDDGNLVLKDGKPMRLAPGETIQVDGGVDGITPGEIPKEAIPPRGAYEGNLGMVRALEHNSGRKFPNLPTEEQFNKSWADRVGKEEGVGASDVMRDLIVKMNRETPKAAEEVPKGQPFKLATEETPVAEVPLKPEMAFDQPEMSGMEGQRAKYRAPEKPPPAPLPEGGLFTPTPKVEAPIESTPGYEALDKFEVEMKRKGAGRVGSTDYKIVTFGPDETPAVERVVNGERETIIGMRGSKFDTQNQAVTWAIGDAKAKFALPTPKGEAGLRETIADATKDFVPPKSDERGAIGADLGSPQDQGYKFSGSTNPEVAERMKKAEGFDNLSFWERLKSRTIEPLITLKNTMTRAHPELEKNRYAVVRDILRNYDETVPLAKTYAYEAVKGITSGLGPEKSRLFTQMVLLPDLIKDVESGKYAGRIDEQGNRVFPFGYRSVDEMRADVAKYQSELANLPGVRDALSRRETTIRRIVEEQVANGLLEPKVLEDPRYYHHQVLDLMRVPEGERWKGGPFTGTSSKDVRLHAKGYQIERKGSVRDYNTAYAEAEFEWMAQAIAELRTKWTMDKIDRAENIAPAIKAEAERKFGDNWKRRWKELIPPGYETWQPDPGNWFYLGRTITEKMLDKFMNDSTLDVQAAFGELPENLIVGGRKTEWVIPSELKRTLGEYRTFDEHNPISKSLRATTTAWKQYTLFNPMRVAKYLFNNTTGDLDITLAYDPKILKYVTGGVVRDLYNYSLRKGALPTRMMEAMERGAINSGITIHEIPDISNADMLNLVTGKKPGLATRYFNKMKDFNTFRENVLRLAAYEYFKDEIAAGKDPIGASNAGEVRQIRDPKDRAAKLSRELVGDYGDISKGGQWLRSHMIPFYSWMEINAPRYYRLLRNAATEPGPSTFGETLAKKGAGSIARFTLQATAMFGLVNAWNMMMFPDENRKLNTQKGQLHLILGRDSDTGRVYSIRFQGALSDALQWVGQETAPMNVKALAEGETTVAEGLKDAVKAPVERVWGSLHPAKSLIETAVGKTTYPNFFSNESFVPGSGARPIRDKAEAMAKMFSLDVPYRIATGKPSRGLGYEALSVIGSSSDPGERAYENIRSKAMDFLQEREQQIPSTSSTPKTLSLYYYKQAQRFGDTQAADKYLSQYYQLEGTPQGMEQSIRTGKVINMIPKKLQLEFLSTLSPRQVQDLGEADDWYLKTFGR